MVFSAPLDGLTAVLVKKGEFTEQEIATAERFIEQNEQIKVYSSQKTAERHGRTSAVVCLKMNSLKVFLQESQVSIYG
jgi:hypothetical protein